jgi:hypothetical protein
MIPDSKYIDHIYHFKGAWDIPSFCGLKIIVKKDITIMVVTELYDSNPGSSVTSWIDKLATELIRKFDIDPEKLILIEHNPDRKSSLEFFKENFDKVNLDWDGTKFMNPVWERISVEQFFNLLKI